MRGLCGLYKWDDRHAFGTLAGISVLLLAAGVLAWPTVGFAADETKFVRVDRVLGVNQPEMFVEDEFIVVFTRDARANTTVGQNRFGMPTITVQSLQDLIDQNGVNRFARQFLTARARPAGSKYPDLTGHYKVKINAGVDLDTTMDAFARNPQVDHVEKIGIHPIHIDPNDPLYKDSPIPGFPFDQWHYFDRDTAEFPGEEFSVQADLAWEVETGDSSVVVAIADSGVRYFHSDLGGSDPPGPADNVTNGNVWVNNGEIPGDGIDNDGNGFVDDIVGYDFVESASGFCQCCDTDCGIKDNDPRDDNGHGTHVSGTVAAITNNDNRVAGVAGGFSAGSPTDAANGIKIMVLRIGWNAKCFGQCGYGFVRMDYAAEAMNYVADQVEFGGVNVAAFNASWDSSNSGGIDAATDNLLAHDVMIIHSAGNSGANLPGFLGNKPGVMNVAATDRNGNGASFTNFGSWVDLAAPGVDIVSTWHHFPDPTNDYFAVLSGTSMSAPHACGVAALLESCDPTLSGPDKFNIMVANVRDYFDSRDLGSGILNAKLALDAAGCTAAPGCAIDADCDDGNVCNGAETCLAGTCQDGTPLNCDDGNPCTDDDCVDNKCVNTTEEDGTECDDGLFCNGEETCTAGVCGGSTGDPCRGPDDDDDCAESCDEKMGNCEALDPDGSACDDDDACTENDQCTAGSCGGTAVPDGSACDDDDACTENDQCTAGSCGGTAVDCSGAGDQCNTASCDPNGAEGNCGILTPVTNGTPCSDGNACTTVDACSGGVCVGGAPANCDDGSDCTTDGCDSLTGCTNTPLPLGTPCGNPTDTICNGADSCDATGTCQDNFATDGTSCEDGLVCNGAETCLGGLCTPGTPIPGCCKNDADCDNGDVCDGIETCVGNICVLGTPLTCSDGNVCTDDLCDPVTGCFFQNNTAPCDDGQACNEGETC
ncbi:MAG: S8 family serine peptidase, partial [Planctomycetota bacterium]|nr:S8 family serine peptidase [Planctomycetota bacterium]